jgi:tRNA(fMet)-specific endonuclease VapC
LRYLLDTNTCVHAIKRSATVIDRLKTMSPADLGVSITTLAELWFGALKSSRPAQTRASVDAFLRPFEVLPLDRQAAEAYAAIRLDLERAGRPIGERDLLIASIARSRSVVVVTHNVGEFSRVSGLKVEDWL